MNEPFWTYPLEDDKYTINLFSIIGKSLYIATRYESYCRSLNLLVKIKSSVKSNESNIFDNNELKKLTNKIDKLRLFDHIEMIFEGSNSNEIYNILIEAKNYRNYIAHELTLGIENTYNKEEYAHKFIDELKKGVETIIRAEYYIIKLISIMTNDHAPTKEYIVKNMKWIFG